MSEDAVLDESATAPEVAEAPVKTVTAEEIEKQIKPLSKNGFVRFFQKLYRGFLSAWHSFADKHPKAAKWTYTLAFFIIFSQGITIFQLLLFLFLPNAFGMELAATEWFFPAGVKLGSVVHPAGTLDGVPYAAWTEDFYLFFLGKPVARNAAGTVLMGGGLGFFAAFMIATFLAQCINFPLQRNITFRSHGNPWYQAMWYFIGWVLIQPFCDFIGSLWKYLVWGIMGAGLPVWLSTLLDTLIMGAVAMGIFFVIFLIIFPDYNKVAKTLKAKLGKLQAAGVTGEKLEKAQAALVDAEMKAKLNNAEKEARKTESQASAKAMAYFASVKNEKLLEEKAAQGADEKLALRLSLAKEKVPKNLEAVSKAIAAKDKAAAEFLAAKAEKEAFDGTKAAA